MADYEILETHLAPSELISLLYYYESQYVKFSTTNGDKAKEAKEIARALEKKIDEIANEIVGIK